MDGYGQPAPGTEAGDGPPEQPGTGRTGHRRWPARAGVTAGVLALLAGGTVWLLRDEVFRPFGDPRACAGSTTALPKVIEAGGVPLPADASDVRYVTGEGTARVSFLTDRLPDFLHRAGLVPQDARPLDGRHGSAYALGTDETERPAGLCGPALRGPAWSYLTTGPGPAVDILVERSPFAPDAFRSPARVSAAFGVS
ncbi:hypothetical protein ACGFS9_17965 [Streptomyces sp. NPDC048566]|uniref:hypothetical protein n=1 Tax=Streptomyces sp. NPDC048566 TaxID=3365569 RepID=UPI00372314C6